MDVGGVATPRAGVWGKWREMADWSHVGAWGNLSTAPEEGWYTSWLVLLSLCWTAVIVSLVGYEQRVLYTAKPFEDSDHAAAVEQS